MQTKDMRGQIREEPELGDPLSEVWDRTKKNRMSSNKQFKVPDMKCMSIQQKSTAIGGAARNKYFPSLILGPKCGVIPPYPSYDQPFSAGELCGRVAFHHVSNQLSTGTFVDSDTNNALIQQSGIADLESSPTQKRKTEVEPHQEDLPDGNIERCARMTPPQAYARGFLRCPDNAAQPRDASNPKTPGSRPDVDNGDNSAAGKRFRNPNYGRSAAKEEPLV